MLVKIPGNLKMLKSQTIKGLGMLLMPGLAAAVWGPGKPCFCRGRTEGIVDQVMELGTSGAGEQADRVSTEQVKEEIALFRDYMIYADRN